MPGTGAPDWATLGANARHSWFLPKEIPWQIKFLDYPVRLTFERFYANRDIPETKVRAPAACAYDYGGVFLTAAPCYSFRFRRTMRAPGPLLRNHWKAAVSE